MPQLPPTSESQVCYKMKIELSGLKDHRVLQNYKQNLLSLPFSRRKGAGANYGNKPQSGS